MSGRQHQELQRQVGLQWAGNAPREQVALDCRDCGDWGIRGMELRSSKRHTGDGIYNQTSADLCSVDLNQGGDNHRVS